MGDFHKDNAYIRIYIFSMFDRDFLINNYSCHDTKERSRYPS